MAQEHMLTELELNRMSKVAAAGVYVLAGSQVKMYRHVHR